MRFRYCTHELTVLDSFQVESLQQKFEIRMFRASSCYVGAITRGRVTSRWITVQNRIQSSPNVLFSSINTFYFFLSFHRCQKYKLLEKPFKHVIELFRNKLQKGLLKNNQNGSNLQQKWPIDIASQCICSTHIHNLLGGLGFPHLGQNITQFFTLPLGPQVRSQLEINTEQMIIRHKDSIEDLGNLLCASRTSRLAYPLRSWAIPWLSSHKVHDQRLP